MHEHDEFAGLLADNLENLSERDVTNAQTCAVVRDDAVVWLHPTTAYELAETVGLITDQPVEVVIDDTRSHSDAARLTVYVYPEA